MGFDIKPHANNATKAEISRPVRLPRIPSIHTDPSQKEKCAQHILSLGNPRHRLNVDGMKRKQQGHEQAWSDATRCPHQQQKKQDHIGCVNQQAGEVMSRRVLMEQLPVERVRKPGERVPVRLLGRGEGPRDRVQAEAVVDVGILGDIAVIVVIDEGMAIDRVVQAPMWRLPAEDRERRCAFQGKRKRR